MNDPIDPSQIYRFFTEVGIINQLISTKMEAHLPGRMSAIQFGILGHLARQPAGETPLQLAKAFQVPKTTMTHMLAGLEALELLSITPNPKDKRSKIAQITQEGGAFLSERMAVLADDLGPLMAELTLVPFVQSLPHLENIRKALDGERDPVDGNGHDG